MVEEWLQAKVNRGMRYRVAVGVLYCGELDYALSEESIRQQANVELQWFVIRNMPNKAAHKALYQQFMESSGDVDFSVKVDADMVLRSSSLFERLGDIFRSRSNLDMVTVPVRDFFSGADIVGLHAFRNSVFWPMDEEDLFVDNSPIEGDKKYVAKELSPAADHCFHCSAFHAFHYGVHRGLKLRVALTEPLWAARAGFHVTNYDHVWANARCNLHERRLWLACIGFEMSLLGMFDQSWVAYTDSRLETLFSQELEFLTDSELRERAISFRQKGRIYALRWKINKMRLKRKYFHLSKLIRNASFNNAKS